MKLEKRIEKLCDSIIDTENFDDTNTVGMFGHYVHEFMNVMLEKLLVRIIPYIHKNIGVDVKETFHLLGGEPVRLSVVWGDEIKPYSMPSVRIKGRGFDIKFASEHYVHPKETVTAVRALTVAVNTFAELSLAVRNLHYLLEHLYFINKQL